MPHEQPYEQDDGWFEEGDELPPRPRRRIFGAGCNPVALALLGVLLIACGFIGGVLVEKHESSSGTSGAATSGLTSRLAALPSASAGTAAGSTVSAGGGFGGFAGVGASHGRPTAGTVAYLAGKSLYVTDGEGNTVKVTTSDATSVSRTVTGRVSSIHPGETVTVAGTTGSDGSIAAESISVSSGAGAALAALFGASKSSPRSSAGGSGRSGPELFGSGG